MFKTMFKGMKRLAGAGLLLTPAYSIMYCQEKAHSQSEADAMKDIREDPEYKRLFEGNDIYRGKMLETDPEYFEKLSKGQAPKYLFIGCSDSRVPPNELTNTGLGELFIHRNVASLVVPTDFNVNSVLQFSIEVLKVRHIIVMGHTHCGGIRASVDGQYHGMIDQWLVSIREVYQKHSKELDAIENEEVRIRKLTEYTVEEQVLNLCKNQFVQKAWSKNQPLFVHGWVCEVETGKIIDLKVGETYWKEIREYFTMDFSQDQRKVQ